MLRHRDVLVFILIVVTCAGGAGAQVLSYSTYVPNPNNAAPGALIAANSSGEVCAVFNGSSLAGAKFKSDGSVAYTIPLSAITSQFAGATLVAIDSSGNCYFAGFGQITPTPGAFQSVLEGNERPWVEKFDQSGSLSYATYLSGSNQDSVSGIAADSDGNVYVTGFTTSIDFPTLNAYQPVCADCRGSLGDLFISVLNPTGTHLIYSTYWGGSNNESSASIAVDAAHNAYITGTTFSTDFPLVSPLQTTPGTAFVIKLGSTGTPIYSTYLGQPLPSTMATRATAIAADPNGSAYVTGSVGNVFAVPVPLNPVAFVNKYSADGSAIVYSASSWGTNSIATGIAADAAGHAYVSGYSQNVPLVAPIQTGNNAFVSVLNSSGTTLTFSTALGQDAKALSVGIDSVPNIYVAGSASNSGSPFPILHATYVVPNPPTFASPSFLSKISLSPGIALSLPGAVDFTQNALVTGRDSLSIQVLVANTNASSSISITNIAITAGDFTQANNCITTLGPATDCVMSVTLAPTVAGTRAGAITITDTAPGSPHTINLTGTGLVPPGAALNPTSLTFGAQAVGTSSGPQQVTLTNLSNVPLVVSKIAASGDFSASGSCNGVPPPSAGGNNCPISVFFSPTAVGTRSGVLTVSFGATGGPQTVNLSGQSVASSLGLTVPQGSDSTAVVAAGASAEYGLSIGGAGMSGMASLTCAGAPRGAVCTLPNTLTVDGNTPLHFNVDVSTTSRAMAAVGAARPGWFWAMAMLGLVVLPWSQSIRKTANRCLPLAMVAALLLSSCGGSSNNGPPPNPNGTPAGTYTLTVAATVGSNVQSTSLTLTVQ